MDRTWEVKGTEGSRMTPRALAEYLFAGKSTTLLSSTVCFERKQFHVLCKRSLFKSVCVVFNENTDWDKDLVQLEKRC